MASDSDVMTTREAAAFLGAHVETVRRFARRGEIPSFKVGKDWRYRKEALQKWEESQHLIRKHRAGSVEPGSVLVVDDDDKVCRALSRIIERLGCTVRVATDGAKGLALVAQEVPDLILLDLMMPGMTGPQFLEQLRKKHPDLPVVIVTGFPDSELMKQAMQYAPLMLFAKPADRSHLERTVRMVVGDTTQVKQKAK